MGTSLVIGPIRAHIMDRDITPTRPSRKGGKRERHMRTGGGGVEETKEVVLLQLIVGLEQNTREKARDFKQGANKKEKNL